MVSSCTWCHKHCCLLIFFFWIIRKYFLKPHFGNWNFWNVRNIQLSKNMDVFCDYPTEYENRCFSWEKCFMHVHHRNKCLSRKIADTHKIMTDTDMVFKPSAFWQLLAYLWRPVMGHKFLSNFLQRKHRWRWYKGSLIFARSWRYPDDRLFSRADWSTASRHPNK